MVRASEPAVEDVVSGDVDEVGADLVASLGDPAHGEAVDRHGAVGVGLTGVDGSPRCAVDHDVGAP